MPATELTGIQSNEMEESEVTPRKKKKACLTSNCICYYCLMNT